MVQGQAASKGDNCTARYGDSLCPTVDLHGILGNPYKGKTFPGAGRGPPFLPIQAVHTFIEELDANM